jgi:hypothetical protein
MAALSTSYIILTALVQNIFYINAPYNVKDAFVMLKTKDFSTTNNETWSKLFYDLIDNKRTPVFKTFVPSATANSFLQYKVKFYFRDNTIGETQEWRTFITNDNTCNNITTTTDAVTPTSSLYDVLFVSILNNCIVCFLVITKLLYQFSKSQCTMWFNK